MPATTPAATPAATAAPALTIPVVAPAVGARLTALLAAPGRYRTRWLRHVARSTPGRINQAAVTRVLAEWLWLNGEAAQSDLLPRALRDRVSRALGGRSLSAATLRLFVAAFAMTAADEAGLWELFDGAGTGDGHPARGCPPSCPGPED
ncbi:hypothetical protein [Kitasatospora sp. NBC_00315]|uniref:hypothetical protein n=1 Tax=Kitasatospora sp. NBC_00315 TaxID=2975963 RepID=UPI003253D3F2